MLEKLDRTKNVTYYNTLLRGRVVKYYNSDNRYYIHGVMPSMSDKTESLEQCIIIMTNIYDPDTRMKYMKLVDFYNPVLVQNKETLKFIMEIKEVKPIKVIQPIAVQRIQSYQERNLEEKGINSDTEIKKVTKLSDLKKS